MEMQAAQAILKALQEEGTEVIFGYPGGSNLYIYDALYDSSLRHVLARHEQGAIHAAQGYARATGKVRWINQLPRFEREKSRRGQITYRGPVLAGGRLILVGSNGALMNFDPVTGNFQSQTAMGVAVSQAPVVANSTLFVLDDSGRLHAFR